MSEVKDLETRTSPETAPAVQGAEAEQKKEKKSLLKKWRGMPRKKRRRIVRWFIFLLILGGGALAAKHFLGGGGGGDETTVLTGFAQYGSITATVDGSGLTKAKDSETITIATAGTVKEVLVAEGDVVTAGTPLFVIDSDDARSAVEKARQDVLGFEKNLATLQKDIAGLNLTATYPGKLMETVDLNPGDTISKGQKVAILSDDTRLRLTQYYSYAYEGMIYEGQSVDVSIPALMASIPGTVEAVHMVSRITPEGTKLFSADILVDNEGALSAKMVASATVNAGGEVVYPYEAGELEYYRTGELKSTVNGTVISSSLVDYLQVTEGQPLVRIDGEDSEAEIFTAQQSLEEARKVLENAEKNLANCTASASINGKVIGLAIKPGDEIAANTTVVSISDTSSLIINATVDERNVSAVQVGTMVDLDQWGTTATGTVESVSLSSTISNGVATYPMVISVDNTEESLQVNSNINYSLVASENDNCLTLPLQAVRTVSTEAGESLTVVYVKSDDPPETAVEGVMSDEMIPEGYWPVPVEIGISDNYNVEIKSGVEEGTEVFTQVQISSSWGF